MDFSGFQPYVLICTGESCGRNTMSNFQSGERGEDMPISLFFSAVCPRINTIPECGYYYVQHASSARHNFKGLEKYSLPYKGLDAYAYQGVGSGNSEQSGIF